MSDSQILTLDLVADIEWPEGDVRECQAALECLPDDVCERLLVEADLRVEIGERRFEPTAQALCDGRRVGEICLEFRLLGIAELTAAATAALANHSLPDSGA